jgi:ABC-2 type transport system ATP-binding protein
MRARGTSIIFSTHRMESVEEMCDYIALINRSKKVLDGPVRTVRDAYRSQTYEVEGKGRLMVMHPDFEVVEHKERENGHFYDRIRIVHGTPNDLLRYLIGPANVEIHAFRERIPSINEIFIQRVRETHPDYVPDTDAVPA